MILQTRTALRFKAMWLKDEGCEGTQYGMQESLVLQWTKKVNLCQSQLKYWSKRYFGNVWQALIKLKRGTAESIAGHQLFSLPWHPEKQEEFYSRG